MRNKRVRPARVAAAACLIVLVVTVASGCSGSESSSAPSGGLAVGASAGSASAVAPRAAGSAPGSAAAGSGTQNGAPGANGAGGAVKYAAADQQISYTAQLTVRAANVASAVSRATSIVSAAGGYVSGEDASAGNGQPGRATATVTFKIPAAAYPTTLAALSGGGLGTQLSLSQQAQNVTEQVADVASRVTSDQAAIAQLRSLLAHAGSVGDLLSVQDQINSEESDLESMIAQQNALNRETAYSTVTVTLVGPQALAKPPAKSAPPPTLAGGLAGGWRALRLAVDWLLAIVGALAPFGAAIAVVTWLTWRVRRRLIRRRAAG